MINISLFTKTVCENASERRTEDFSRIAPIRRTVNLKIALLSQNNEKDFELPQ